MENENPRERWYVLFVRTNSEDRILKALRRKVDSERVKVFVPKAVRSYGKKVTVQTDKGTETKKVYIKEKKLCFPGYVFISSQASAAEFAEEIVPIATNVDGSFCFLNYGEDKSDIAMRGSEKSLLERLMGEGYCIEPSKGYKEGDKIVITEGTLMGLEGRITKVNVNRRVVTLAVDLMGSIREVMVMIDMTKN